MDTVFDTESLPQAKRYGAWRDAICDVYLLVDVKATRPETYRGSIKGTNFGAVGLTDIVLSEQTVRRNGLHIARQDKDCYYLQLIQRGSINVLQRDEAHRSNPARAAIFSATERYELQVKGEVRAFYLEIPRTEFAQRFPRERIPVSESINTTGGLGRIATDYCASLAAEGSKLDDAARAGLGNQLMDMLAFTLLTAEGDMPAAEGAVKKARLRSVQQWIEAHIAEPDLSLERIAGANGMSLRYLHVLFEACDMSASEWIWNRRLQLAYDCMARGDSRSITSIAFDFGFNSSSHFSTVFRRKYGMSPRDIARPV